MKFKSEKLRLNILLLFATMIFYLLLPNLAYANLVADIRDVFLPNTNDLSLNLLSQLFGELIAIATGNSSSPYATGGIWLGGGLDPFQYVTKYFNIACLVVGSFLGGYTVFKGMVETSSDGEFLGKDLNNKMVLFRSGVSVAMVFPVFEGYCALQVLIAVILVSSVGIADTTWKAYFGILESSIENTWQNQGNLGSVASTYALKIPSPQVAEIAYKTFEGYTCVYGAASEKLEESLHSKYAQAETQQQNSLVDQQTQYVSENLNNEGNSLNAIVPNNQNGGVSTGYTVIQSNAKPAVSTDGVKTKTATFIDKWRNQLFNESDNNWNNLLASNVNSTQLDNIARQLFDIRPYNQSDFDSNGALAGVKPADANFANALFVFGTTFNQNASASDGRRAINSGSVSNATSNTSCGSINFGSTNQLTSANAMNSSGITNQGTSSAFSQKGQTNFQAQTVDSSNMDKRTQRILYVYVRNYGNLNAQIKALAFKYVNDVNQLRFKQGMAGSNNNFANEFTVKRDELLRNVSAQLETLYHDFEKNIINDLYDLYNSDENDFFANAKRFHNSNMGSVTNLPSNVYDNVKGNFVDFIKIARMNAESDGWVTGGMWFMSISNSVSQLHSMTSVRPYITWASPNPSDFTNMVGSMSTDSANVRQNIDKFYGFYDTHAQYSRNRSIAYQRAAQENSSSRIAASIIGLDLENLFDVSRHPLIILTEAGHKLIASAAKLTHNQGYQMAKRGMSSNIRGKVVDLQANPAQQSDFALSLFGGTLMVLGIMMAYVIPAMPFLLWSMGILGWLVRVVEAILIAPLWGIMHLHPEGSKYSGKGGPGYGLLMSLAMTPTLMILGLIASITLTQVFGLFIIYIFAIGMNMSVMPAAGDGSIQTALWIIAMNVIFAMFMQRVFFKTFSISMMLPDQALKWVGLTGSNLTEYGQVATGETMGKIQEFGGASQNLLGNKVKEAGMAQAQQGSSYQAPDWTSALGFNKNLSSSSNEPAVPQYTGNRGTSGLLSNVEPTAQAPSYDYNPNQDYSHTYLSRNQDYGQPNSDGDKALYNQLYGDAYKVASDAGLSARQSSEFAANVASNEWGNDQSREMFNNWAQNRGSDRQQVFARNPAQAQQVINGVMEAGAHEALHANNQTIAQNLSRNYVQGVSSSNVSGSETAFASAALSNAHSQQAYVVGGESGAMGQQNWTVPSIEELQHNSTHFDANNHDFSAEESFFADYEASYHAQMQMPDTQQQAGQNLSSRSMTTE